MFLIATADERFWRLDQPCLLVGEWCRTYSNRETWARQPHEVLPYHWDDRAKLARDYRYLDQLHESLLVSLAGRLNRIHGTTHSVRYWRIVLSPWLSMFLTILFDRYESLQRALASGRATHTVIGNYDRLTWLPGDIRSFVRWGDSDAYNQFLFSRLIHHLGGIQYDAVDVSAESVPGAVRPALTWRRRFELAVWRTSLAAPSRFTRIALIDPALSRLDQVRMQLRLWQCPTLSVAEVDSPQPEFDPVRRRMLEPALESTDAFGAVLRPMVIEQFPTAYLERYEDMVRAAAAAYPREPRVIFTAIAYEAYEGFKFWAASQVERGAKLVGTQHGCHYGTARFLDTEDHQRRIYDRFFSWGWTDERDPNVRPLAAAKFNRARRVQPRPDGHILFAGLAWPRYAYRLYSVPIAAAGTLEYFREQFRFVEGLSPEVRQMLLVRLFPNDRGWRQRQLWKEQFPGLRIDGGEMRFLDRLRSSRLIVCLAVSTTQLEAFAANFPAVLFWNPSLFEVRPDAEPYFAALEDVGILFRSPEAAAAKVEQVWRDPLGWWRGDAVQEARRFFCDRFTRTSARWQDEWASELMELNRTWRADAVPVGRQVAPGVADSRPERRRDL